MSELAQVKSHSFQTPTKLLAGSVSTLLNSLHLSSKGKLSSPTTSLESPDDIPSYAHDAPVPVVDPTSVRALIFNGTLSVQVKIAEDELPLNTDLPINSCYVGFEMCSFS